jgi:hypothetical protein
MACFGSLYLVRRVSEIFSAAVTLDTVGWQQRTLERSIVRFMFPILRNGRFMLRHNWIVRLTEYSCIPITNLLPPSVADPGCLSRIPDPGSRILDPKTATKERGEKNCCHTLFCSHKFHKTENYFVFELPKKKIWANFPRIIELFMQKIAQTIS